MKLENEYDPPRLTETELFDKFLDLLNEHCPDSVESCLMMTDKLPHIKFEDLKDRNFLESVLDLTEFEHEQRRKGKV